jgi:hypothetical protein
LFSGEIYVYLCAVKIRNKSYHRRTQQPYHDFIEMKKSDPIEVTNPNINPQILKSMKKNLFPLALIIALAIAVTLPGCNKNDSDIERIENLTKELQSKITILETFKDWAETQGGGFQSQIDALEAALKEAQEYLAAGGPDSEIKERLDALIGTSTLTIAQIQSQLEEHDDSIEELYELLDGLGGGDVSTLLSRIAALEQADKDIINRINNLSVGGGGGGLSVSLINELISQFMAEIVKSVTYIPDYADGAASVSYATDAAKVTPVIVVEPLVMNFMVVPSAAAEALATAPLSGVLNSVTTRALAEMEADVTLATASDDGVLTVTFRIPAEAIPPAGDLLQIALKADTADGNAIAGEFVNLTFVDDGDLAAVELGDFKQNG